MRTSAREKLEIAFQDEGLTIFSLNNKCFMALKREDGVITEIAGIDKKQANLLIRLSKR